MKKILTFLSPYNSKALGKEYMSSDGNVYSGVQTNEAPLKYILDKHTCVEEILCIVTEQSKPMIEHYEKIVKSINSDCILTPIEIDFNESEYKVERVTEKIDRKDTIIFDITGGFRDVIVYLMLISRVLKYTGAEIAQVIYSNFQTSKIEDITDKFELFDLVNGMDQLTEFGNVKTLRKYYENKEGAPQIHKVLDAMQNISNDISLCQTTRINERLEDFRIALKEVDDNCSDLLMKALLPTFKRKYDKFNITKLIKWCINNNMLQQALTLYKENIPDFILDEKSGVLGLTPRAFLPGRIREYESENYVRFRDHFLKMSNINRDDGEEKAEVKTIKNFESLIKRSYFIPRFPVEQLKEIAMDYLYLKEVRNLINHANDWLTDDQFELFEYLEGFGYLKPDQRVDYENLKQTLLNALEHLKPIPKKERN